MSLRSSMRNLLAAALMAAPMLALPAAQAQIGVSVSFNLHVAPPALPVYEQPPLPAPGYLWTPGYWGYGEAGYFWVPGVWVQPPTAGLLWTPGYWGYEGGAYGWHEGYWGPHVGFYGGVNYGYGFGGVGFAGGEWRGGVFAYNRAAANFGSVRVTNVYEDRVIVERTTIVNVDHVSFNGGVGIQAHASAVEMQAANERHFEPTPNQVQHHSFAAQDRSQLASVNQGHPATMASSNINEYHQVAQQHVKSQPISESDRSAGRNYNPNTREANQDQRIANGLRSGQMTSGEAARAERTQSNIDQQVHKRSGGQWWQAHGCRASADQRRAECSQSSDLQRKAQWQHDSTQRGQRPRGQPAAAHRQRPA